MLRKFRLNNHSIQRALGQPISGPEWKHYVGEVEPCDYKPWNVGIPMSSDAKHKSSISHRGQHSSRATEFKRGHNLGGIGPTTGMKIHSEANKRRFSERMKGNRYMVGRKFSDATKLKMSIAKAGKPKPKIECPHCGKIGGLPTMKQWHFENCPYRKQ